jgi:hypothetical protein
MSRARAVHARRSTERSVAKFRRELELENGIEIDPHQLRHPQGHHRFYEMLAGERAEWVNGPSRDNVPIEVIMLAMDLALWPRDVEPHRIPRRMRP